MSIDLARDMRTFDQLIEGKCYTLVIGEGTIRPGRYLGKHTMKGRSGTEDGGALVAMFKHGTTSDMVNKQKPGYSSGQNYFLEVPCQIGGKRYGKKSLKRRRRSIRRKKVL